MRKPEALLAGRLIERSDIRFYALRPLMGRAQDLATSLDHAAYDCFYLALAEMIDATFVTADRTFFQKATRSDQARVRVLGRAEGDR